MKNKKADEGLEYLKQLNVKALRSSRVIIDEIERRFGKDKGDMFFRLINERAKRDNRIEQTDEKDADKLFYNTKNEDFALGLFLTGSYDGDIVRKACNWIVDHKDFFGKTILEIGCDIGLISCFLAKTFPDSMITAIDRCENGPAIGRKLADQLGLSNIRFICAEAGDLTEQFDTVLSMRVMHENHRSLEDSTLLFKQQAHIYQKGTSAYARTLAKLVKNDGLVISIERCNKNPLLLGWLWALGKNGLVFDPDLYSELKCQEVGKESVFEACVFKSCPEKDFTEDDIYKMFCDMFFNDFDPLSPQYEGWTASIVLQNSYGSLIEGFEAYDPTQRNWKFSHSSVWTSANDDTAILAFERRVDMSLCFLYKIDISHKDEWLEHYRRANRAYLNNGYIVKHLSLENGCIVSGENMSREQF